jgi:hypothetical protein
VATAEQLLVAADDGAVNRIVLAAGTYDLARAVSISRALTIEAEEAGTVVLDAKGLFGPVVSVQGTATLSGLNVTGGSGARYVCWPFEQPNHALMLEAEFVLAAGRVVASPSTLEVKRR